MTFLIICIIILNELNIDLVHNFMKGGAVMIALFLIVILVVIFLMFKKKKKNEKIIKKDEYVVIDPDGDINITTSKSVFETYLKNAEKKGK